MEAVTTHERALGNDPRDVSAGNLGYDIESQIPGTGKLRFLEVIVELAQLEVEIIYECSFN